MDLSHPLSKATPRATIFPEPNFHRIRSLPEDPLNITEMQMVVHIGTHVDAPCHFLEDGPGFHEIPLDRLSGPGVVVTIEGKTAGQTIGVDDFRAANVDIRPSDIVVLHTGWGERAHTHDYHDHPYVTPDAAGWLVEKKVKLFACDMPTPDMPTVRRPLDYDWPVHHILLRNGILISENVTGLKQLGGQRAEFMFVGLNIEGSDGAPARVLGRTVHQP